MRTLLILGPGATIGRRRYPTSRATSGSTFSSAPPRGRWIPFDLRHKVGAIFYWLRAPTWQLTQTNDDREKTLNLQANARAYKEIHPRFALLIKTLESSASFGLYILENLRIGLWTRLRCVRGSSCLFFLYFLRSFYFDAGCYFLDICMSSWFWTCLKLFRSHCRESWHYLSPNR